MWTYRPMIVYPPRRAPWRERWRRCLFDLRHWRTNPLARDILWMGRKAIDDPDTAARWVPYLIRGDV